MTKLIIASPYINRDVPCRLSLDPPLLNINLEAKTPRKNDEKFLYCSSNVGVINFDTSCIADFERLRDLCLLFEKNNTFSDPVPATTAYAKKCFPYLMKGGTFPLPVFTELFYFDLINSFSEFCYAESTSVHNSRVFYATFLSNSPMFYPGYINEAITSLRSLLFPPSMTPSKKDLMRLKYFIFYLNYYFASVSYSHYSLSPLNAACAYEKAKQRKMEDPNFFILEEGTKVDLIAFVSSLSGFPAGEFNKKLINNI